VNVSCGVPPLDLVVANVENMTGAHECRLVIGDRHSGMRWT
jgi:hypothetical protein